MFLLSNKALSAKEFGQRINYCLAQLTAVLVAPHVARATYIAVLAVAMIYVNIGIVGALWWIAEPNAKQMMTALFVIIARGMLAVCTGIMLVVLVATALILLVMTLTPAARIVTLQKMVAAT
jgi:hypothetical protein